MPNTIHYPQYGSPTPRTPWGAAQSATHYGEGVVSYSTAGHGGFKLDRKRNAMVPEPIRTKGGWYEEDCEWAAVVLTFQDLFTENDIKAAHASLKNYNPDGYEQATGILVTPEESYVLRERMKSAS